MNSADPRPAMLADMGACAYRLGMAFGAEAERSVALADKLQYVQLFERCFFAVRVGIALELRLRREGRWEAARAGREDRDSPADRAERDPPEDERPEAFEPERPALYTEGDRDREAERATLPLLLDTLQGVAADAAALPGPPPAELPTLRDLLARYASDTAEPPAATPGQTYRARLASSTAAVPGQGGFAGLLTRPPDRPSRGGAPSPSRPATGPPSG